MFDVTKDVIEYFKDETRDEDEFQKIWAELVQWKTERDAEMKKKAEEDRKRKEAQVKNAKLATLRENAAAAVARYMVELFAGVVNKEARNKLNYSADNTRRQKDGRDIGRNNRAVKSFAFKREIREEGLSVVGHPSGEERHTEKPDAECDDFGLFHIFFLLFVH